MTQGNGYEYVNNGADRGCLFFKLEPLFFLIYVPGFDVGLNTDNRTQKPH